MVAGVMGTLLFSSTYHSLTKLMTNEEKFFDNTAKQMSVIEDAFKDKDREEIEEGMDEFEILRLVRKRGKKWIVNQLKDYE